LIPPLLLPHQEIRGWLQDDFGAGLTYLGRADLVSPHRATSDWQTSAFGPRLWLRAEKRLL
jgi:hypothetical protein